MININVKDIRKEDAITAHALTLTLKHFNVPEGTFNVVNQKEKYYVFIGEDTYEFGSFDQIPMFVICAVANTQEELDEFIKFYNNVIKVGFSNNDALEYLNFYSESEKKLAKVK
jgi:hypothetical protein